MGMTSKPQLACEVAADRVLAARLSQPGTVDMCAASELAPGCVVPDMVEANLRDRGRILDSVRQTLDSLSGRSRDVIAVLPDAAIRVVLLDFDSLPAKHDDAEGVVRFRLKKSLPFDVDKAKVSYHVQTSLGGLRLVAAVALTSVVEEYEAAFRDAGYSVADYGLTIQDVVYGVWKAKEEKIVSLETFNLEE